MREVLRAEVAVLQDTVSDQDKSAVEECKEHDRLFESEAELRDENSALQIRPKEREAVMRDEDQGTFSQSRAVTFATRQRVSLPPDISLYFVSSSGAYPPPLVLILLQFDKRVKGGDWGPRLKAKCTLELELSGADIHYFYFVHDRRQRDEVTSDIVIGFRVVLWYLNSCL